MDVFGVRKRREKVEAERLAEQQKKEQEKLFREFLTIITDCIRDANKSKKFKTFSNNTISDKIGDMVYFITNKETSIVVGVQDSTAAIPPFVCQVDIRVREDSIHVIWGAYGPEKYYKLKDKEEAKRDIKKHINRWGLFR